MRQWDRGSSCESGDVAKERGPRGDRLVVAVANSGAVVVLPAVRLFLLPGINRAEGAPATGSAVTTCPLL